MNDRHPKDYETACLALEEYLTQVSETKAPWRVEVYAFTDKHGFRIAEIDWLTDTAGSSYMRSTVGVFCAAVILAAEDFVLTYGIPPTRPGGWETDLDQHEDARYKLQQMYLATVS
jgi:hypothetical protein